MKKQDLIDLVETVNERLVTMDCRIVQIEKLFNFYEIQKICNGFYEEVSKLSERFVEIGEHNNINFKRLNEMTCELKGIVSMSRACLKEKKHNDE